MLSRKESRIAFSSHDSSFMASYSQHLSHSLIFSSAYLLMRVVEVRSTALAAWQQLGHLPLSLHLSRQHFQNRWWFWAPNTARLYFFVSLTPSSVVSSTLLYARVAASLMPSFPLLCFNTAKLIPSILLEPKSRCIQLVTHSRCTQSGHIATLCLFPLNFIVSC